MSSVVFVTGTGTEVGKTWFTAAMIKILRDNGVEVHARKPVQSYEPGSGPTDAEILAAATGEDVEAVCPKHRWYAVPMAPPMAAEKLGEPPVTLADLVREVSVPATGVTFVEGAGGPRSPMADDGDSVALVNELRPDLVVLVADPELGMINSILLCVEALGEQRVVTFLNRYDASRDLHRRNLAWLLDVSGLDVVVEPGDLIDRLRTEAG